MEREGELGRSESDDWSAVKAGGGEEGERKCVLHGVSRPWPPYRYDIAASESPQGLPGAGLEQTTPAAYFNDQSQCELLCHFINTRYCILSLLYSITNVITILKIINDYNTFEEFYPKIQF